MDTLTLDATVTYGDVDREELILLQALFKLLQNAAIAHANRFGSGTVGVATRGESWVLSRIAVAISRYPRAGEAVRVVTWSTGIKGFKGYRDFRVLDAEQKVILSGSSVWLYISLRTGAIVRVPRELADQFPVGTHASWCPELERMPIDPPARADAVVPITLRYSDFDVNQHVNNTAYLEFVQTALARAALNFRPGRITLKFSKAIAVACTETVVRIERMSGGARFSIEAGGIEVALGDALDGDTK